MSVGAHTPVCCLWHELCVVSREPDCACGCGCCSAAQVTGRTALELGTLHDNLATMPVSRVTRLSPWQCRTGSWQRSVAGWMWQLRALGYFTVAMILRILVTLQAAVRGLMSREHQMLTWHTIAGDLETKQRALAEMDKSKVGQT